MGEWNIRDAKNTIYLDELNNLAWLEQSELIEIYGVEETQKTKDPRKDNLGLTADIFFANYGIKLDMKKYDK